MLEGIYWYDFSGAASLLTILLATLRVLGVQVCGEGSVPKPLHLTKKFPLWCHPPPYAQKKTYIHGTCTAYLTYLFFVQIIHKNFGCIKSMSFGHYVHRMVFGPLTVHTMSIHTCAYIPAQKHCIVPIRCAYKQISGLTYIHTVQQFWYVTCMGGGGEMSNAHYPPPPSI